MWKCKVVYSFIHCWAVSLNLNTPVYSNHYPWLPQLVWALQIYERLYRIWCTLGCIPTRNFLVMKRSRIWWKCTLFIYMSTAEINFQGELKHYIVTLSGLGYMTRLAVTSLHNGLVDAWNFLDGSWCCWWTTKAAWDTQ